MSIKSYIFRYFSLLGVIVASTLLIFASQGQSSQANSVQTLPEVKTVQAESMGGDFKVTEIPGQLTLEPGATETITISIQNTGDYTWQAKDTYLEARHPLDLNVTRYSEFANETWETPRKLDIKWDVRPGHVTNLKFKLKAPERGGLFKETFVLNTNQDEFISSPLSFWVNVMGGESFRTAEQKLDIDKSTQTARWVEKGTIIATTLVSTGLPTPQYETPSGEYEIMNHIDSAYSNDYQLWMENWMAIKEKGDKYRGYGLHKLPHWNVNPANFVEGEYYDGGRYYSQGKLYEDYAHLGEKRSHGCIRFGLSQSKVLFDWAPNGMTVTISD